MEMLMIMAGLILTASGVTGLLKKKSKPGGSPAEKKVDPEAGFKPEPAVQ